MHTKQHNKNPEIHFRSAHYVDKKLELHSGHTIGILVTKTGSVERTRNWLHEVPKSAILIKS